MPTSNLSSWVNGPTRCQIKIYLKKERLGDRHRVSSKKLLTNLRDLTNWYPSMTSLFSKEIHFPTGHHGYIGYGIHVYDGCKFLPKNDGKGLLLWELVLFLTMYRAWWASTSCDCFIHGKPKSFGTNLVVWTLFFQTTSNPFWSCFKKANSWNGHNVPRLRLYTWSQSLVILWLIRFDISFQCHPDPQWLREETQFKGIFFRTTFFLKTKKHRYSDIQHL